MADNLKDQINDLKTIKQLENELLGIRTALDQKYKDRLSALKAEKKGIIGASEEFAKQEKIIDGLLDRQVALKNYLREQKVQHEGIRDGIVSVAGEIEKTTNHFLHLNKLNDKTIQGTKSIATEIEKSSSLTSQQKTAGFGFLQAQTDISKIQQELADSNNMDLHDYLHKLDTLKSLTQVQSQFSDELAESGGAGKDLANEYAKMFDHNQKVGMALKMNALLSDEQKTSVMEMEHHIHGIKNTFGMVKSLAKDMLTSPVAGIGIMLIGVGLLYDKMYEFSRASGFAATNFLGYQAAAGTASLFFKDGAENAKLLAEKLGNVNEVGAQTALKTSVIGYKLGLAAKETTDLVNMFGNLQGKSSLVAADMLYAAQHLSVANGVMPNAVMSDLAKSTQEFAMFSKNGGENMIRAAVQAAKLGVSVGDTAKMAEGLLDFENSINAEMEASAMLGKEVNFQRARELAFQNDIEGATKEMLRQVGGINEFNNMNLFQRKALAKAMGVEVDTLQQMLANQENAQTVNGKLEGSFSAIGGVVKKFVMHDLGKMLMYLGGALLVLGNMKMTMPGLYNGIAKMASGVWGAVKGLGSFLMGSIRTAATWMGSLVPAVGKFVGKLWSGMGTLGSYIMAPLKMLGNWIMSTKIMQGTLGFFKSAGSAISGGFKAGAAKVATAGAGAAATGVASNAASSVASNAAGGVAGKAGGAPGGGFFSKINPAALIKGAFAMLIMAGALFVMGKALQQFSGLNWGTIAMAGASLIGLGLIMAGFGALSGFIYAGSLALAAASIALMLFGAAVGMVGIGLGVFVNGLSTLGAVMPVIGANIGSLVKLGLAMAMFGIFSPAIMAGAWALGYASVALMVFGVAIGIVAAGFNLFVSGLNSLASVLPLIGAHIGTLTTMVMPIFGLAASLMILAGALAMLASAGPMALPILIGLGFVAGAAAGLFGGGEGEKGGKEKDTLLSEIQGLRADLKAGLIAVNLDGTKISRKTFSVANNQAVK
jgi:hypothetical protein